MKRIKVYSYLIETDDKLFPLHIYPSISEAARDMKMSRTTIGYHLSKQGSYKFGMFLLSLNSLTSLKYMEPIPLDELPTDTNEKLHIKSLEKYPFTKKSWLKRVLALFR